MTIPQITDGLYELMEGIAHGHAATLQTGDPGTVTNPLPSFVKPCPCCNGSLVADLGGMEKGAYWFARQAGVHELATSVVEVFCAGRDCEWKGYAYRRTR